MTGRASAVAFVPARAGSTRVPHKNIRRLEGHPLLAYAIAAARASGAFDAVVLCTDSPLYRDIGVHYGADVPFLRPDAISGSLSPDIEWVRFALSFLRDAGRQYEIFSILRPTNPFRRATTIAAAMTRFLSRPGADSLRAVRPVSEHPGKMWVLRGDVMHPLLPLTPAGPPWHSQQFAALPEVFVQNASLEIAWSRVALDAGTIAGEVVIPWISEGYDGFDINQPADWDRAIALLRSAHATLPEMNRPPFPGPLPGDGEAASG